MASDFPVVFALYPDVTQLDFTGPLEVLARLPQARIVLAAAHGSELAAGGVTFADVRPLAQGDECALPCVPGGFGCSAAGAALRRRPPRKCAPGDPRPGARALRARVAGASGRGRARRAGVGSRLRARRRV